VLVVKVAEVELLIIGAGPCGLVAAITAARYGVEVRIAEKRRGGSSLSRALVVSTRGMELMRRIGLEPEIRAGAADVEPTALVCGTLASTDGTVMPLGYPSDAEAADASPSRPAWVPQSYYEPLLVSEVLAEPTTALTFGTELVGLKEHSRGFRATLLDVDSGAQDIVDARFVIGADGAHSAVRAEAGIAMEGEDALADYERVEFRACLDDVLGGRAHALYVLKHPDVDGAVLARRGREDRWSLSRERPQGAPGLDDLSADDQIALIRTATGVADLHVTIERLSRFTFAAQIAEHYRRGDVFLIGDAAHRMTPRGGTGMNTGIQDGFDLGWKLAWVLRGWADPGLLDTYEAERRPIGLHNVGRSAEPGGARRSTNEALSWDLDGRLAHAWLPWHQTPRSTVDLVDDGLTVFTAAGDIDWTGIADATGWTAPLNVTVLQVDTAATLGVPPTGALLVRPDGHEVARWSSRGAPARAPFGMAHTRSAPTRPLRQLTATAPKHGPDER
jgi:2-polyprenyl-6-methoxyphenol hydroxylase-like FAD-dependent oxidoreductase